ncbi:hypothetical protein VTN02DRAFT_2372 [Thermoascus thermophilus]
MSSCCASRRSRQAAETAPLLPRRDAETDRQRRVQRKLHAYEMLRALNESYLPSTDQAVAHLRALLASAILNPDPDDLSDAGLQLVRDGKLWLRTVLEVLQEKNDRDQLQAFLWHLSRSRASLDTAALAGQASRAKARADTKAAYDSLRTVGGLLLTNADFRLFVDDLATVGRRIFADASFALSEAAHEAGREVAPSGPEMDAVKGPGADERPPPSAEEIRMEGAEMARIAADGAARTAHGALESAEQNLSGEQKDALFHRLKQAVLKLRERTDYSSAVATLSDLVQRYARLYSGAAETAAAAVADDVDVNDDLRAAVQQFWDLVSAFGDREEWNRLRERFHEVLAHAGKDPEFEKLMAEIGGALQRMLTDPGFLDSAGDTVAELKEKTKEVGAGSELRRDVDAFLRQVKRALQTVPEDPKVSLLISVSQKLSNDLCDAFRHKKDRLAADLVHIFLPLLIRDVQHVPIPRIEISVPEMDLLLENVVLEPGRTIHHSSFLPYRTHISTRTDIALVTTHATKMATDMKTAFTVTVTGLDVSASEVGYWIRAHAGPLFRFTDEGIASVYLDERGVDLSVDVEIGRHQLAQMFNLRAVRVHIHKLDYVVHRSRFRLLLWIVKPFLKQLVRRVLERKIAEEIVSAASTLNRELVFARERLRATRIANPPDLTTFVRAVTARLRPAPDPNVHTRVAVDAPAGGVFRGVYAPGSVVKLWHEEAARAREAIERGDESDGAGTTWRNSIFDVSLDEE